MSVHALPELAARVAGEVLALSALLGSALKLDGRLTVQTKSDGPLDIVAADYYGASGGKPKGVRGFARLDDEVTLAEKPLFAALTGAGSLAITIEPVRGGQTYQGIVDLSPKGIAASAETYFEQSEQLPTLIRLAAAPVFTPGSKEPHWRAAGLMLQATPGVRRGADDWDRLSSLAGTVEDLELLDTTLTAETLLWRLFNQEEVRVLPAEEITFRCDCDGERIATVLKSYTEAERANLADADGVIRAKCEFCGTVHEIGKARLS
ncbi:molecular chaperone Hsp33 [Rhizomicrobium electricum]|nr:molecular chaperone Hsp33 [Rhizomicrobium electricum]